MRRECSAASRTGDSITLSLNDEIRKALKDSLPQSQDSARLAVNLPCGPVAIRRPVGKGEIILISTPLLFTNYGMLDGNNAAYIFRLLSLAKDLPLYRTEAYTKAEYEQQSPFRYFLSQTALRWGLYLTMFTILLFMIFTARRRQRPIPVIRRPENRTLEFTELIGTLYFQKKGHGDLIRKKFTYFAEALRREIQIDVEDDSNDTLLCRKIAARRDWKRRRLPNCLPDFAPLSGRTGSL